MKSKFIVIEGLDGSGKSTQIRKLAENLKAEGIPCLATRQPSDGKVGEMARAATKSGFPLENETIALLFAADRYQHYHDEISPALKAGKYVICDRYYYSNLAYQGQGPDSFNRILSYNQQIMRTGKPDITIFLDVAPEECIRRIKHSRQEISIYETQAKLEQMRERYLTAFYHLRATDNIIIMDTNNVSPQTVTEKIWLVLKGDDCK